VSSKNTDSTAIAAIERARTLLMSVESFDDILAVENLSARARDLARAAGASRETVNSATKVMLDARRLAGKTLAEMKAAGQLADKGDAMSQRATSVTLDDMGLTRSQSSRYQQEASVPDGDYEAWIAAASSECSRDAFLSASGLRKLAARQPVRQEPVGAAGEGGTVASISELLGRKFSCIYADPPWRYGNQQTRAATDNHYQTMTVEQLCSMDVRGVASNDAHLHLWATSSFLFDAKQVMDAWGFTYKSSFVWVKPQMGIGNYWRLSHEFLLLGVRGNATRFNDHSLRSWVEIKRGKHSSKPDEIRRMIERASAGPYLEMFGRTPATGWTVLGNQISAKSESD